MTAKEGLLAGVFANVLHQYVPEIEFELHRKLVKCKRGERILYEALRFFW